jgi:TIR domain
MMTLAAAQAQLPAPTPAALGGFDYSHFLIWALVWGLIACGLCLMLFKLYSKWPAVEHHLTVVTLVALPFAFALLTTAHLPAQVQAYFPRIAFSNVIGVFGFWVFFALCLAFAWWPLGLRWRWLRAQSGTTWAEQITGLSAGARRESAAPARQPPSTPASMASRSIFISYRRQDSADVTGRIYDRLLQRFERGQVFKDVDSIPLGVDFRKHLSDAVGRCDALLVVIGPQWLTATGTSGRRLDDAQDFVRIEIEAALSRDIPVIPLLVGGANLPAAHELPASLSAISYRNGIAIRSDPDFHRDIDRLLAGMAS